MKFTASIQYGILAMQHMEHGPHAPFVSCTEICESSGMPTRYVLQVLRALVKAGLLDSRLGVYGGYRLAKSPKDISLLEIVQAIDGAVLYEQPHLLGICPEGADLLSAICEDAAKEWWKALKATKLSEFPSLAPSYA